MDLFLWFVTRSYMRTLLQGFFGKGNLSRAQPEYNHGGYWGIKRKLGLYGSAETVQVMSRRRWVYVDFLPIILALEANNFNSVKIFGYADWRKGEVESLKIILRSVLSSLVAFGIVSLKKE